MPKPWISGGMHGLLLENYGDAPFFPGRVPAHVAASLTALAVAVKRPFAVPLGINVLRNDGQTAAGGGAGRRGRSSSA